MTLRPIRPTARTERISWFRGFRKGKAPRKVIEGMYGASVFYDDAINILFPEVYDQAIKEAELKVVGMPSVTDMDLKDGVLT